MSLIGAFKAFFKALKQNEKNHPALEKKESFVDVSHLQLLSLLQKQGRLIDFLKEDITSYSDAQIGSAVRKIHQECAKILEDYVSLRPVLQTEEGAKVSIPKGYDVSEIKVVGKVKGEPPYEGILRHKGWKAQKRTLPALISSENSSVVAPAEVEV